MKKVRKLEAHMSTAKQARRPNDPIPAGGIGNGPLAALIVGSTPQLSCCRRYELHQAEPSPAGRAKCATAVCLTRARRTPSATKHAPIPLCPTTSQAAYTRDFALAATEYSNAITAAEAPMHAPLSASLHAERAAAHLRLKDYDAALKDCAVAIYAQVRSGEPSGSSRAEPIRRESHTLEELKPTRRHAPSIAQDDCKAAWLTKADALHALERHEEAARELQTIRDTFGGNDTQINHALQRAQFEVTGRPPLWEHHAQFQPRHPPRAHRRTTCPPSCPIDPQEEEARLLWPLASPLHRFGTGDQGGLQGTGPGVPPRQGGRDGEGGQEGGGRTVRGRPPTGRRSHLASLS